MSKKFKISVMGASGVGKTVFFASYFHLLTNVGVSTLNDGKKHYSITIKSQKTDDKITEIVTPLFEKGVVPQGTDVRVDFSFFVPSLDMDVELIDLPGGFTERRDYWDEKSFQQDLQDEKNGSIRQDLREATGALFFISGEDLIKRPVEALKINRVFAYAIEEIRKHNDGNVKGRADVPIWFIITKCDAIPDVSEDELRGKIGALLEAAHTTQEDGDWLPKTFFKKGKNVRIYKSIAMGKWEDAQTPPSIADYKPVNVVEPMEDLFICMRESQKDLTKTWIKLGAFAAAIVIAITAGLSYWFDRNHWQNVLQAVQRARESDNYVQAIAMLDNFKTPFPASLLPAFVRAGGELKSIRDDVYKDYEAALYAPIAPEIAKVDTTTLPRVDDLFLDTTKKIDEYLKVLRFAEINPENYAKVRNAAWYFEMGRLFAFEQNMEGVTPDEEFNFIVQSLNYEVPEAWREQVQARIGRLLRHWAMTLPPDAGIDELANYSGKVEQLAGYHDLTDGLMADMNRLRGTWEERRENIIVQNEIGDLLTYKPGEGMPEEEFNLIIRGLNYETPEKWRERVEKVVNNIIQHWTRTLPSDARIEEYADYIDKAAQLCAHTEIKADMAAYLTECRETWSREIDEKWRQIAATWIAEANSASPEDGLDILAHHMAEKTTPAVREMLKDAQDKLYDALADKGIMDYPDNAGELRALIQKFPSMTASAKGKLQERISQIRAKQLAAALNGVRSSRTIEELSNRLKSLGEDSTNPDVAKAIEESVRGLVDARLKAMRNEASAALGKGDFAGGRRNLENSLENLNRDVQSVLDKDKAKPYTNAASSTAQSIMRELMHGHAAQCKQDFQRRKNTSRRQDVTACLDVLKGFINTWPEPEFLSSGEGAEVKRASDFLSVIQGGIKGRLMVVNGDFTAADGLIFTPSIYVVVNEGGRRLFTTSTEKSTRPVFRDSRDFTWTVETGRISVTAYKAGTFSDSVVDSWYVDPSGFYGFASLSGTGRGKHTLTIDFTPSISIPAPPSDW
ncbi:MAG: hypothetical protein IJ520_00840 [Synergistaceae bacterium]|nr:hypothetical protein [Synergistaceae bacterium]